MFIRKREYERLQEQIAEWQGRYDEARKEARKAWNMYYELYEDRAMFTLKDYDVALLWPKDGHTLKVWNKGRFEERVRSVELSQDGLEYVPHFRMTK